MISNKLMKENYNLFIGMCRKKGFSNKHLRGNYTRFIGMSRISGFFLTQPTKLKKNPGQ